MKIKRQNMIIELIEKYPIETQEDLISKLREKGYYVTQATVSRDIRELKLVKSMTDRGEYVYILPKVTSENSIYSKATEGSVKTIACSLNNIVIKTFPGMANAVAARIDSYNDERIIGCVAGDDCIILVTDNPDNTEEISDSLKEIFK